MKNGGRAFPVAGTDYSDFSPGMTLRQWYAGTALQGILANSASVGKFTKQEVIAGAFSWADAMIAFEEAGNE